MNRFINKKYHIFYITFFYQVNTKSTDFENTKNFFTSRKRTKEGKWNKNSKEWNWLGLQTRENLFLDVIRRNGLTIFTKFEKIIMIQDQPILKISLSKSKLEPYRWEKGKSKTTLKIFSVESSFSITTTNCY